MKRSCLLLSVLIALCVSNPILSNHLFWIYFEPVFVPVAISDLTDEDYRGLITHFAEQEYMQAMFFAGIVRVITRENITVEISGVIRQAPLIDRRNALFWLGVAQRVNWRERRFWPEHIDALVARAVELNQETLQPRNRFHRVVNFLNGELRPIEHQISHGLSSGRELVSQFE
ncbi:MAG: hypothetical protein WCK49_03050 [Myxococcaceae bacterium]